MPSVTVEREITHLRESGKFPKPEIKDTSFIWGALRVGGGGIKDRRGNPSRGERVIKVVDLKN